MPALANRQCWFICCSRWPPCYRLRIFIIEAGGSFALLGQQFQAQKRGRIYLRVLHHFKLILAYPDHAERDNAIS